MPKIYCSMVETQFYQRCPVVVDENRLKYRWIHRVRLISPLSMPSSMVKYRSTDLTDDQWEGTHRPCLTWTARPPWPVIIISMNTWKYLLECSILSTKIMLSKSFDALQESYFLQTSRRFQWVKKIKKIYRPFSRRMQLGGLVPVLVLGSHQGVRLN